ncbi:hypothetical protein [Salibacterium qingdaonense]|nr:hypothetical protein [Salibacterium qingdaonense]
MIEENGNTVANRTPKEGRAIAFLYKNDDALTSIFELAGTKEDDMTASAAWTLASDPHFLQAFLDQFLDPVTLDHIEWDQIQILMQNYMPNKGITDLEVFQPDLFHIILEAKKGWVLPADSQLQHYSNRFSSQTVHRLVVLSECNERRFHKMFPDPFLGGIPLQYMSWESLYELAKEVHAKSKHKQKFWLQDFIHYVEKVVPMQQTDSNWVYVVSLSDDKPDGWDISWKDIVEKKNYYFHPTEGGGWPKNPPNYIAFRYDGQLQSIHHIDDYEVIDDFHPFIQEIPPGAINPHFLYTLGPPIYPPKIIKNGPSIRWANRAWCMLDTLLTSDTITEAREISVAR